MKTRDFTLKQSDYKGRMTACADEQCPCRPCWSPHQFGTDRNPDMRCLRRERGGCPYPLPAAEHQIKPRAGRCSRCHVGKVRAQA